MRSGSKNPKILLDQIAKFMARETEEMSDEQFLEETADGTETGSLHVEKLKRLFEERAAKVRRERLAEARARYNASMANRETLPARSRPSVVEIRQRIQQLFTNGGEIPVGVAFRNGQSQSDDDLFSLWDHLCELGAIDQEDS